MLRQRLSDDLKTAMKSRDQAATSALRLVLAALKDRDIAARSRGITDGIDEAEIVEMLQKMVKQRNESIALYKQGNRQELVDQEQGEIDIIERYLPKKMSDDESDAAVDQLITELGATSIKDMGRVMAAMKERFAGRMDFAKAGARVKQKLG
ncbi:GatB/YqeY domain-containing protein [Dongia soli]|uniref:GatB/YqeY domain-containing protein n=1 Tax=Dongia soli TaxID=600628 RepID=A0ABU5EDU9_9PROT|nr:GatB/YqeY domain-containing protein [Dongia soli]MDY0884004.1 GatB/YqeY domain-containing protein [Dongia soli]